MESTWLPLTNLTDGIITLRQFQISDGPQIFAAVLESLDDLTPWMSWAQAL